MFIITFSLFIILIYLYLILLYLRGWFKSKSFNSFQNNKYIQVSVIIPFRNESDSLRYLLDALIHQDYPEDFFEIIAVNDHSEDNYETDVLHYQKLKEKMKIYNLPENISGKKSAIDFGIHNAKGDFIMTIDADCMISEKWISTFVNYFFEKNKPDLIMGLVDYKFHPSIFVKIQNLEFLSLIGSSIGAAGIGKAIYCNGANLFYNKDAYLSSHDPLKSSVISGDDTFLLHEIKKINPNRIQPLKSKGALVITSAQLRFSDFLHQRIRWASKSRYYKDKDILFSSFIVLITNLFMILWYILLFSVDKLYFIPITAKVIVDGIFLFCILTYFNKKTLFWYFPILQVFYPFYISIIGIYSIFGTFKWKGRIY